MENRADILNELNAISPVISGIEKRNVFTVPAGYFENLGTAVLMNVKEEMAGLPGSIEPLMQVPQGYFESLADNILNRIKGDNAATELKELSPVLYSIQHENVFAVPQGYFGSLADNILNRIKAGDNAATELKELSPVLYSIQNENVFSVLQGYFESLSDEILAKVKPQQAEVVSMQRRGVTTVLKYAVAAVFTGVIALGVYKFSGTTVKGEVAVNPIVERGKDIAKDNKFDEELAKVSDDDIIKYLQADGTNIDAALVANKMDETELPSQEDYLTDDKALDKFLDNIDLNDLQN
jgi:uncharacterized protein YihD (DUF1040 family)